jgi:hypothetical protein
MRGFFAALRMTVVKSFVWWSTFAGVSRLERVRAIEVISTVSGSFGCAAKYANCSAQDDEVSGGVER